MGALFLASGRVGIVQRYMGQRTGVGALVWVGLRRVSARVFYEPWRWFGYSVWGVGVGIMAMAMGVFLMGLYVYVVTYMYQTCVALNLLLWREPDPY